MGKATAGTRSSMNRYILYDIYIATSLAISKIRDSLYSCNRERLDIVACRTPRLGRSEHLRFVDILFGGGRGGHNIGICHKAGIERSHEG